MRGVSLSIMECRAQRVNRVVVTAGGLVKVEVEVASPVQSPRDSVHAKTTSKVGGVETLF